MQNRLQDRALLLWGVGLLAASLLVSLGNMVVAPRLFLANSGHEGLLLNGTLTLYALLGWLQQATLVLGAALVAAHALLSQLVPLQSPSDPPMKPDADLV